MILASGSQLAQVRPANTSTASAFTATLATEITLIAICNTTGTAANASIFHDDDGSTFDQTTALLYAKSIAANTTEWIRAGSEGSGITVAPSGQIGVQSGTNSALTFTFYGVTEQIANI
jgi:hypothetical protein